MNKVILKTVLAIVTYLITCCGNTYSQTNSKDFDQDNYSLNIRHNIPEHNITVAPVNFQIKEAGDIKISIYNNKGEVIETIVDGEMEPGDYNVFFKTYENLESGEYYYTIEINGITELRKPIVIK